MSSDGELFSEELNDEYLEGVVHESIRADSSEWSSCWDLRELGRGPHTLPLRVTGTASDLEKEDVKVGEIQFEFMVNPDADGERESLYIVKPDSVVIRLWPAKIPKVGQQE